VPVLAGGPPSDCAPTAIHLAAAASISGDLGAFITNDQRMIIDARALGLPVRSPT
jgi:hypothetical protein